MSAEYKIAFWRALTEELHEVFDPFDERAVTISWHPMKEFLDLCGRAETKALLRTKGVRTANSREVPGMRASARDSMVDAGIIEVQVVKYRLNSRSKQCDDRPSRWRLLEGWSDRMDGTAVANVLANLPDGD